MMVRNSDHDQTLKGCILQKWLWPQSVLYSRTFKSFPIDLNIFFPIDISGSSFYVIKLITICRQHFPLVEILSNVFNHFKVTACLPNAQRNSKQMALQNVIRLRKNLHLRKWLKEEKSQSTISVLSNFLKSTKLILMEMNLSNKIRESLV